MAPSSGGLQGLVGCQNGSILDPNLLQLNEMFIILIFIPMLRQHFSFNKFPQTQRSTFNDQARTSFHL